MREFSFSINSFKSEIKENIWFINCSLFPEVSKLSKVHKQIMSDKEKFLIITFFFSDKLVRCKTRRMS